MSLGFEILRLLDYLILIYSCESLQVSGSKRRGFPKRPLPTLRLLMDHKRDAAMLKKLVFLGPIRLPDHNMEDLYYQDRHQLRRARHQRRHLGSLRQWRLRSPRHRWAMPPTLLMMHHMKNLETSLCTFPL